MMSNMPKNGSIILLIQKYRLKWNKTYTAEKGISYDIIAEKLNNYNEYEAALLAAKERKTN